VTGVAVPALNGVWSYQEDAERDAVLGLLERVADVGVPHCLQLAPGCSHQLRELGKERGMRREVDIPLMALTNERELPPLDEGDLVIEVLDPEQAVIHAEVAAAGFHAPLEAFLRLMTPAVIGRPGVRTYVGRIGGEPVATGVGVCLENHVGIFNLATLPAHRRRGYGASITGRAVRDGIARGARWAWLQSSPDGYGIYERLGFKTVESWECWIAS
jgi:N-acetylglutamate synthase